MATACSVGIGMTNECDPRCADCVTANGHVLPRRISPWVARDYAGRLLGNAFGERSQQFRTAFESATAADPCRGCGLGWSI